MMMYRSLRMQPILGGVEILYEKGLLGHSDADVLLHAIMDTFMPHFLEILVSIFQTRIRHIRER